MKLPSPIEAPVQPEVLRARANNFLRNAVDADADIRHALVDAAMTLHSEADELENLPLESHDIESWATFLPTVRVGGALPVTFRLEGDRVIVEVTVPYVPPEPQLVADPDKIPIAIAEGFPVPLTMRYKLPAYSSVNAAHFIRHIVREIYHHEIDEQLRVDDSRPFAPHRTDSTRGATDI